MAIFNSYVKLPEGKPFAQNLPIRAEFLKITGHIVFHIPDVIRQDRAGTAQAKDELAPRGSEKRNLLLPRCALFVAEKSLWGIFCRFLLEPWPIYR